ncbi:MAG: hypothetical protein Q7J04_07360 [Microcella sp.]|nr:hypothetical protein [Microcella sp.]
MTVTRAVIHLGPIKSGTTALSRYLTTAAGDRTLPDTVLFPMGDLWFGRTGAIVRQRAELERLIDRDADAELTSALSRIGDQLRSRGGDHAAAIFVIETGGARLDPQRTTAAFAPHVDEVVYVVMARPQTTAVTSIVAQRAKMWDGERASLDPRQHLDRGDLDIRWLDYDALMTKWMPTAGEHRLVMLPFLEGDQGTYRAIQRLFHALELGSAPAARGIEGRRIHPTFSREGMQSLVELKNRAHRWRRLPGAASRLEAQFREAITAYHAAAIGGGVDPSGRPYRPWRLDDGDRSWVAERFRAANERFLARVDRTDLEQEWADWARAAGVES